MVKYVPESFGRTRYNSAVNTRVTARSVLARIPTAAGAPAAPHYQRWVVSMTSLRNLDAPGGKAVRAGGARSEGDEGYLCP